MILVLTQASIAGPSALLRSLQTVLFMIMQEKMLRLLWQTLDVDPWILNHPPRIRIIV